MISIKEKVGSGLDNKAKGLGLLLDDCKYHAKMTAVGGEEQIILEVDACQAAPRDLQVYT